MTHIFNISMLLEQVPELWKTAFVTPIPKSSAATKVSEFCPISLLPTPCKVMEKVIRNRLFEWLSSNNLIPDCQHGFLPRRSTTTCLLDAYHDWSCAKNRNQSVNVIYFDLSKAFDTVDHLSLLSKLDCLGIRGNLLGWFMSYLSDRRFLVRFDNALSTPRKCTSGVPQGGVLSPLLFIVYTYEIGQILKTHPMIGVFSYADDIKISAVFDDSRTQIIENALIASCNNLREWTLNWNFTINESKCQILSIGDCSPGARISDQTSFRIVESVRDLGIHFQSNLRFSTHLDVITLRARKALFCLFRAVKSSDFIILLKLYKSCVVPLLEYGSPIWNPYLKKDIDKIESVQKLFTRLLYCRCFREADYPRSLPSYSIRLQELGLKSLYYRRVVADLMLAFKILRGEVSLKPSKYWIFRPVHCRRPCFRITAPTHFRRANSALQHTFFWRTCSLLNKLPPCFLTISSSALFKKMLSGMDVLALLGLRDVS